MTDFESNINPYEQTRHNCGSPGIYGPPPLRGCRCVICHFYRARRIFCAHCGNLGSWDSPCWGCGRGVEGMWPDWGTQTEDVALGG
jgi:hypothetical protein